MRTFAAYSVRRFTRAALVLAALGAASFAAAVRAEVYETPENFVASAFAAAPAAEVLWPAPEVQRRMAQVLGHPYRLLRIRYWRMDARTAWVLHEVGKEEEITIGFVVEDGRIAATRVLEFRESRGWEIKFPSFTRQFDDATLIDGDRLDRSIDNITGATLSVGAYQRLAQLALLLHAAVMDAG